jgi:hypothetical protein
MKKFIAFLLAALYFVFTTPTLWQVNGKDNRWGHGSQEFAFSTSGDGLKKAINNDILADKSLRKAPKHLTATGKIKIPRSSTVVLAFRNFLSFSTTDYHKPDISMATPLRYFASIYLKNGVLRI